MCVAALCVLVSLYCTESPDEVIVLVFVLGEFSFLQTWPVSVGCRPHVRQAEQGEFSCIEQFEESKIAKCDLNSAEPLNKPSALQSLRIPLLFPVSYVHSWYEVHFPSSSNQKSTHYVNTDNRGPIAGRQANSSLGEFQHRAESDVFTFLFLW